MLQIKPGDRVDCRIYAGAIVGPYKYYDEIKTFEIIGFDDSGCYLFVPAYIILKDSFILDKYQCRVLGIDPKFIDEQSIYIGTGLIYNINSVLDGMPCNRCKEFFHMAQANQENGTMICWSCRNNPYR